MHTLSIRKCENCVEKKVRFRFFRIRTFFQWRLRERSVRSDERFGGLRRMNGQFIAFNADALDNELPFRGSSKRKNHARAPRSVLSPQKREFGEFGRIPLVPQRKKEADFLQIRFQGRLSVFREFDLGRSVRQVILKRLKQSAFGENGVADFEHQLLFGSLGLQSGKFFFREVFDRAHHSSSLAFIIASLYETGDYFVHYGRFDGVGHGRIGGRC